MNRPRNALTPSAITTGLAAPLALAAPGNLDAGFADHGRAILETQYGGQVWSVEALESAVRVAFGQVLTRGVIAEMKPYPVDPAALQRSTDKYIASLPVDALRKFADGDMPDEEAGRIVKQLVGDEVVPLSRIDDKLGHLIGEYAAGRANETFFTAEFARQ